MVKLELVGNDKNAIDLFNNDYFILTNVDGFTLATVDIASGTTPSIDGDVVNNVTVQPRPILIDLQIKQSANVEQAKRFLTRAIKPKLKSKLRLTQDDRTTEIEGIVDNITMPRFGTTGVTCQISLYCSIPYWQDAQYIVIEISRLLDKHYFPIEMGGLAFPVEGIPFGEYNLNNTQTYVNDGDAEAGMLITIIALGTVFNPIIYAMDGSYIGVNESMTQGDVIEINTNRGEKSVKKNGNSIFSKLKPGSTFLQLAVGDNQLTVNSDAGTQGNMYFTITFKRRFV